jgi:hypothetical protein
MMNQQQMYPYLSTENGESSNPFHQQLPAEQPLQRPIATVYQQSYYYTSHFHPHPDAYNAVMPHPMHATYYDANPHFWPPAAHSSQVPVIALSHDSVPYNSLPTTAGRGYYVSMNGQMAGRFASNYRAPNTVKSEYYFTSLGKKHKDKLVTGKKFYVEVNSSPLLLDIELVKNGVDQRTSLMIRNIPNK